MTLKLRHIPVKSPADVRVGQVNFTPILTAAGGLSLSGVPTVTSATTAIAISNVGYNSTAVTIRGETVAAAKAVQFTVTGGVAGRTYTLTVTAATSSETFVRDCRFKVI